MITITSGLGDKRAEREKLHSTSGLGDVREREKSQLRLNSPPLMGLK